MPNYLARPYYQPGQFRGPDLAAIQQNALLTQRQQQQNLMGQYQLDMMPEEVNYLRRKRQLDLVKAEQGLIGEQQSMAESARKQAADDLKAIVPLIRMTKDPRARVGLVAHAMEVAADAYGDKALQGLPLPGHPAWQNDEYLTEIEKALGIETPEYEKRKLYTKEGKEVEVRSEEEEKQRKAEGFSEVKYPTPTSEEKPKEYTKQQKIDDLASYYNSQRAAAATAAKEGGEIDITSALQKLDRQHRLERWRIEQGRPTAFEQGIEVDEFGYYIGEIAPAEDGSKYVYIGNDTWRKISDTELSSEYKRSPTGFKKQPMKIPG